MTSLARIMIVGGTVKCEAAAVLRLTTSSNLVGSTGTSAGFAPLRMRSTISAPRRHHAAWSVPQSKPINGHYQTGPVGPFGAQ
jgi:hypothetical protein